MKRALLIVFTVLLIDQFVKIWVKTHMYLGEEFSVFGDWFVIHFVENNGMAFGMELGGGYGKLILSVFRIIAVFALGYYINTLVKAKATVGLITSFSLILAGAIGNILDSAFYGVFFSSSFNELATFMPETGGYANFLHGRVVDMLYFPILEGNFPSWFPIWANEHFLFFRPVFNIADSAITAGVILILLFQKEFFAGESNTTTENNSESETIIG